MATPGPATLEFLLQVDILRDLLPSIGRQPWQTLYQYNDYSPHSFGIWCALLDNKAARKALRSDSWDLGIGDGKPGFCQANSGNKLVTRYYRFGLANGIRPFVLHRSFHGAFPSYVEIDEEFRLYHDLAEDKERGLLLSFDTSGREIEVVKLAPHSVEAQLKYLRQFQAGTGLYLGIYVDSIRYSRIPLAEVPTRERACAKTTSTVRWRRDITNSTFDRYYETLSRLLCKVILSPPNREEAGIWPFKGTEDQGDVKFIIGIDENGKDVRYTSDPGMLANYFGANQGAPHYVTPVYFRREVLGKYFSEPERYGVADGMLYLP